MSTTPMQDSLDYIAKTARMLRRGEHPYPERAIHLVVVHALAVQRELDARANPQANAAPETDS